MGIVMKVISGRKYAYLVRREGERVISKYIGPASSPEVQKALSEQREVASVPERLRSLFWDTDIRNVHLKRHARYIIERMLEFGSLDAVNWLQRVYTVKNILDVLDSSRALSEKSRLFWRLWFGVENA